MSLGRPGEPNADGNQRLLQSPNPVERLRHQAEDSRNDQVAARSLRLGNGFLHFADRAAGALRVGDAGESPGAQE